MTRHDSQVRVASRPHLYSNSTAGASVRGRERSAPCLGEWSVEPLTERWGLFGFQRPAPAAATEERFFQNHLVFAKCSRGPPTPILGYPGMSRVARNLLKLRAS